MRVSAAVMFTALVVLGGAALLLLSTGVLSPKPTNWKVERPVEPAPTQPPIRLDTLPAPRRSERREKERDAANAAPVIGVGTEEFSGEEAQRDATVEVDGDRPTADMASDAEIRRQLGALARENARIEAALRAGGGPASGTGELIWPVRGRITSPFGQRWGRLHAGIDIGVPSGTPVRASDSGRVVVSGSVGGYGNYICVQHTRTLSTCYAHNTRLGAKKGESVRKGAVIAESGCTGRCYGDHVHFEVRVGGRPVNPVRYL